MPLARIFCSKRDAPSARWNRSAMATRFRSRVAIFLFKRVACTRRALIVNLYTSAPPASARSLGSRRVWPIPRARAEPLSPFCPFGGPRHFLRDRGLQVGTRVIASVLFHARLCHPRAALGVTEVWRAMRWVDTTPARQSDQVKPRPCRDRGTIAW